MGACVISGSRTVKNDALHDEKTGWHDPQKMLLTEDSHRSVVRSLPFRGRLRQQLDEVEGVKTLMRLSRMREQLERENMDLERQINRLTHELIVTTEMSSSASQANAPVAAINPAFDFIGSARTGDRGSSGMQNDSSPYIRDPSSYNYPPPAPARTGMSSTDLSLS